jgi:hypothetical protein
MIEPAPLPDILTEDDVIQFLRIEGKAPKKMLYRLRQRGQLKGFRIGQEVKYHREDVLAFVQFRRDVA